MLNPASIAALLGLPGMRSPQAAPIADAPVEHSVLDQIRRAATVDEIDALLKTSSTHPRRLPNSGTRRKWARAAAARRKVLEA